MATVVVANPAAGRGRTGVEALRAVFRRVGVDPLIEFTRGPGHATELARRATGDGAELVVAVGGDGTVHEVVNGLLVEGGGGGPDLGIVPAGSGSDYAKTFGVPTRLEEAVARLVSTPARTVDAGLLRCRTPDGERTRYFCNIAEAGVGAEVVRRARRLPRWLGGAVYAVAFGLTLPVWRRRQAHLVLDGEGLNHPLTNLVVAVGRVFGGGMRVAPEADPSDGLFDVQVQFGSKIDYALGMAKVYRGRHLPHPRIREARAASIDVDSTPPAWVEADGEVLGTTPATFRIVAGALRLRA